MGSYGFSAENKLLQQEAIPVWNHMVSVQRINSFSGRQSLSKILCFSAKNELLQ